MPHVSELRIRDPFILRFEGRYLLFGTTDPDPWGGPAIGFDRYESVDGVTWDGPFPAFRPAEGFWGTTQFWAPEVHLYDGRWWMLATFADGQGHRGTQVLSGETPDGTFRPWSPGPVTPAGWMCLDGTLHVDTDGAPWLVFCHEWLQAGDGQMYAQRLSRDLTKSEGSPRRLFAASDAPWARPFQNTDTGYDTSAYITDGPYVFEDADGLALMWSSGGDGGYSVGLARSESGNILGPWSHQSAPVVDSDGGHAMVFDVGGGDLALAFHQPNDVPHERLRIEKLVRDGRGYRLSTQAAMTDHATS
jgi:beta-xylosidase